MSRAKWERQPFVPDPEQMALMPDVSGNTINGLGETQKRPPTPIYWHHPKKIAHGKMQRWMLKRTIEVAPETGDLEHNFGGRGSRERAAMASERVSKSSAEFTAQCKTFALANEADLVGITRLQPEWVFEGYEADYPTVIIMAMAMDHAELATAPEAPSVVEVMRQYNRGTRASRAVADWIRQHGYRAEAHGGPTAGSFLLIPPALEAGLGELGKHGSIINREFGASFRLAGVLTDMPLDVDSAEPFGVDEFCHLCRLCTDSCPPNAIFKEKQTVRGEVKWYVDFDTCIPYFNETQGCGICIAVCPWSRPGVAPKLANKMLRRRAQW
ncbi:MAG: 4Fe-4S dicluster domain-containing protein [Ardenticatenaceae bacterium]